MLSSFRRKIRKETSIIVKIVGNYLSIKGMLLFFPTLCQSRLTKNLEEKVSSDGIACNS